MFSKGDMERMSLGYDIESDSDKRKLKNIKTVSKDKANLRQKNSARFVSKYLYKNVFI